MCLNEIRNYRLTKQNHFKNETNCGKREILKITCNSVSKCLSKVFRALFTSVVRISAAVSSQDYFFLALELEIEVERPV